MHPSRLGGILTTAPLPFRDRRKKEQSREDPVISPVVTSVVVETLNSAIAQLTKNLNYGR